ncbi:FAD-dependent oxidoreductase [Amycolatopsis endophytica]|uniref:Mycofactocin system FadH/OYE family oxidoreductase 1 n=1 Tax=Amycolatopsis endophytica TaxID=860233 RepID=A0A853B7J4_9PSEU|nr:mycofactocin system FadH/OYE family oxidoreductase 1 [Amycolatopsis endophytica]NYI90476.1 mycofactocin system FadH/OYE family oxidoreductase 1 [Amycolatopsis endophytica]
MSRLAGPVRVGGRTAPSRVLFGPHETNLARGRRLADRHVAYYRRRAEGGAGIVVTETASVHESDWPYERAPLAAECGPGWSSVVDACRPYGTLVLASLGHAGAQGSSAYHQRALWAASRVPDPVSRELPMEMETAEIEALIIGFRDSAALAVRSGVDGVEIDVGQYSLLRQFCSGLTNHRTDDYGDRGRLLCEVLAAVREAIGDGVLGLRLACDEGAPWGGITPETAPVPGGIDYLVPVRGSAYAQSRPDLRTEPGFNTDLCRRFRDVTTVFQGSVVDPVHAERALEFAGLVEMTRAQIADPDLVGHLRAGTTPRPCVLSNQNCRVRDPRNPVVSCLGEPRSGHETEDPLPSPGSGQALVVGGGPAGLEAARVLALRGFGVELAERSGRLGGMVRVAAKVPGRDRLGRLVDWLESEVRRLGVTISTGAEATAADGRPVIVATGSVAGPRDYAVAGGHVVDVVDVLENPSALPEGPVVVHDPLGDRVGAGVAELLAGKHPAAIVSPDAVIATRAPDLAEVNARLQRAGVTLAKRSRLRSVHADHVTIEDVYTGERGELPCAALIHCGHRLPSAARSGIVVGDAVAPRTIHEAILGGRRAAEAL